MLNQNATAVAAIDGGVKGGFEAYDYAKGKPVTLENLAKSGKEVIYSAGLAAATTGMPLIPAIGLGVMTDWAKDNGNYDVVKTTGGHILEV